MEIRQRLNLDLTDPALKVVHAKQGDNNSRYLDVRLTASGASISSQIESASAITFKAKKPDGTAVILNGGTAISILNGVITIILPGAVTAIPGTVNCEIMVTSANSSVNTFRFAILVQKEAVNANDIISEDYIDVLSGLIEEASALLEQAEEQAEAAAASAAEANGYAQSINPQRITDLEDDMSALQTQVNGISSTYLSTSAAASTYVPQTRKVNGHALSSDVSVTKSDVGLGKVVNQTTGFSLSGSTLTITNS